MTPILFAATALAGGFGAVLRLLIDDVVKARLKSDVPWGIVAINLSGSLILGIVAALATGIGSNALSSVVGVGFLGGYTTFSTASYETVRLAAGRRWSAALITGPGMVIAALLCAIAGLGVGALLLSWLGP